ncbi:MAG: DUF4386 domain-containing protein [Telluria sp.]
MVECAANQAVWQQRLARVAGLIFILAMATGLFAEFYVHFPSRLIVDGDIARTTENLAREGKLYNIGIVNNIITFLMDVVLIWCLYEVTKHVSHRLATLALLFRVIETALANVAISQSLVAMQFVTEATSVGRFHPATVQIASQLHYAYAADFMMAAVFLGCGSALFNYLFYVSRYVPRLLAGWGILASCLLVLGQLAIIVAPSLESVINPAGFAPIVIDEIALGLWLPVRGVRVSEARP